MADEEKKVVETLDHMATSPHGHKAPGMQDVPGARPVLPKQPPADTSVKDKQQ